MKSGRFIRFSIALITFSLSGLCVAATYSQPPAKPAKQWFFGAEISALQAVSNDLHFATDHPFGFTTALAGPAVAPHVHHIHVINPDYDLALAIEGGIHFDKSNDVTVNWLYFNNHDSARLTGGPEIEERFTEDQMPENGKVDRTIDAHVDFETHVLNVEFGHAAGHGRHMTYRFHGGIQVADLENHFETDTVTTRELTHGANSLGSFSTTYRDVYKLESEFTGVGPRFGLDGSYDLTNGFSSVFKVAAALLIGDLDTHNVDLESTTENESMMATHLYAGFDEVAHNAMSESVLVPELEFKSGLKYDYHMQNKGVMTFEGGYRILAYLDAIKWLPTSMMEAAPCVNPWPSQFGLEGFYLAARYTSA